jgi:hypothetical protein
MSGSVSMSSHEMTEGMQGYVTKLCVKLSSGYVGMLVIIGVLLIPSSLLDSEVNHQVLMEHDLCKASRQWYSRDGTEGCRVLASS